MKISIDGDVIELNSNEYGMIINALQDYRNQQLRAESSVTNSQWLPEGTAYSIARSLSEGVAATSALISKLEGDEQ